mmetsp:Transcript_8386/g.24931  ORF Transcript_8386/g.24931 Transcript_8386/m.24931 type:complete len:223 (+) Transcript_8386:381-1049(+)
MTNWLLGAVASPSVAKTVTRSRPPAAPSSTVMLKSCLVKVGVTSFRSRIVTVTSMVLVLSGLPLSVTCTTIPAVAVTSRSKTRVVTMTPDVALSEKKDASPPTIVYLRLASSAQSASSARTVATTSPTAVFSAIWRLAYATARNTGACALTRRTESDTFASSRSPALSVTKTRDAKVLSSAKHSRPVTVTFPDTASTENSGVVGGVALNRRVSDVSASVACS